MRRCADRRGRWCGNASTGAREWPQLSARGCGIPRNWQLGVGENSRKMRARCARILATAHAVCENSSQAGYGLRGFSQARVPFARIPASARAVCEDPRKRALGFARILASGLWFARILASARAACENSRERSRSVRGSSQARARDCEDSRKGAMVCEDCRKRACRLREFPRALAKCARILASAR